MVFASVCGSNERNGSSTGCGACAGNCRGCTEGNHCGCGFVMVVDMVVEIGVVLVMVMVLAVLVVTMVVIDVRAGPSDIGLMNGPMDGRTDKHSLSWRCWTVKSGKAILNDNEF